MKEKKFLNVGEFANICGTTKETLLHYDRKGLLNPQYVASNGYRKYSIEQYFDFDLISLLKESGASLKQIKNYLDNKNNSEYLKLLRDQVFLLKSKQDQLAHRLSMLNHLLEITEESVIKPFDTLFFEERESKNIYLYKIDPDKMLTRESSVECYSNFLMDSLTANNNIDLLLGNIIPKKYAINKDFKLCYLFRDTYNEKNINLKEIPNGRYACIFHHGNIESHINIFKFMIEEITKMNLEIMTDVYVYDCMSYILVGTSQDYIAKYIVKIGNL